jgi:hypothetical protein
VAIILNALYIAGNTNILLSATFFKYLYHGDVQL